MNITIQTALISAVVTFCISLITILFNFYRERFEKEKWKRTIELEERKIIHDENKWAFELIINREIKLFEQRIEKYPKLFSLLNIFSKTRLSVVKNSDIEKLINQLDNHIYGEIGLCMLSDTRDSLIKFRNDCLKCLDGKIELKDMRYGSRTELLELIRRDLSHDLRFHDYKSLINVERDQISDILKIPKINGDKYK